MRTLSMGSEARQYCKYRNHRVSSINANCCVKMISPIKKTPSKKKKLSKIEQRAAALEQKAEARIEPRAERRLGLGAGVERLDDLGRLRADAGSGAGAAAHGFALR